MFLKEILDNRIAVVGCITFLFLGLIWSSVLPVWEGFDEPAHYAYVQQIVDEGKIPTYGKSFISKEVTYTMTHFPLNQNLGRVLAGTTYSAFWNSFNQTTYKDTYNSTIHLPHSLRTEEDGINLWEAQQPPLNYFVLSFFYKLLENKDIITLVFVLRYVGIAISAIAIYFVYKSVKILTKNHFMIYGVLFFTIFNPMFVMNLSRISNEPLTFLLFSLIFYFVIRFFKEEKNKKLSIYIGIILGLGLISKQSFISPLLLIPIIIILKSYQEKMNFKERFLYFSKIIVLILAPAFTISLWWYIRNLITVGNLSGVPATKGMSLHDILSFTSLNWFGFMREIFLNFWGLFGWNFVRLPHLYYLLAFMITIVSIAGLLFHIYKIRKNILDFFKSWKYQTFFVFGLSIILIIFGMMYVNMGYYTQSGGKIQLSFTGSWYSFADATAISILFIGGLRVWIEKVKDNTNMTILVLVTIMIAFNSYALFYIVANLYLT